MSHIRESFIRKKCSPEVINILMASWSTGTKSRYKPHIGRWFDYCSVQNIDPISPPVEAGAEFLTRLFNSGVGYSVVNTARSALSSIIQMPHGVSFGKLPLITTSEYTLKTHTP